MVIDLYGSLPEKLIQLMEVSSEEDPEQARASASASTWLDIELFRLVGYAEKDALFYLEHMHDLVEATMPAFPERLAAWEAVFANIDRDRRREYLLSNLFLPSLRRGAAKEAVIAARERAATSALAVERYRMAHHDVLPEDLEALVPAFLSVAPRDPFDGRALRYHKLPHGYRIYSVGEDRRDDGGRVKRTGDTAASPLDEVFVVER